MHHNPAEVLSRATRVLRERITPRIHTALVSPEIAVHELPGEPVGFSEIVSAGEEQVEFSPFPVPGNWGGVWTTTWFRITGSMPPSHPPITELVIDLGWFDHSVGGHVEGLLFRPNGTVVKALHPRNGWVRLTGVGAASEVIDADGKFTLYLEAAANPLLLGLPPFLETQLGDRLLPESTDPYILRAASISTFNQEVWELARDVEVVLGLAEQLPDSSTRYWRLIGSLDAALDAWDEHDIPSASTARASLAEVLAKPASASAHQISAMGHAHIDSAWLWPVRETKRKVGRTVSNVLALLEGDQPFIYTMSAALHFDWLEENYPDLYETLLSEIDAGRVIPVGGMWVEPDGMLPTGESLVRQMTFGLADMIERFGDRPYEVWLPDSFGYSGALPQLARRAGFKWFLTQKISWNDTTTFPHHTFWWHGIDGTRILTHFPPADTYAAEVTAAELAHTEANFRDKQISSNSILAFGYGDGGGGPTREMVARATRFANLEGAPQVISRTPSEFFKLVEEELDRPDAPSWHGELYLELHRGTLTSQVAMKQGNRAAESLLRTTEYLAAAASLRSEFEYPLEKLRELWKPVLLNQFHDILPGSSIAWVHREARADYAAFEHQALELADAAASALGTAGSPGKVVSAGNSQSQDWQVVRPERGYQPSQAADGSLVLDNGLLRVQFSAAGLVESLLDIASERELVAPNEKLGQLQLFRDESIRWDGWDLDRHTLRHPKLLEPTEATAQPDGIRVHYAFGGSTATLIWRLLSGARALNVELELDWHEREHLLKLAFPIALTPRDGIHETQYGWLPRPIHANTAADEAQFETCSHRFVALQEPGFVVGIVNDGTYGVDTTPLPGGSLVRSSLVRSPRFPDPDTDLGEHSFAFSIVVADGLQDVVSAASTLNAPTLDSLPEIEPLLRTEPLQGNIVIDWMKLADDGSGDLIARLYEPCGAHAKARLLPGPGLDEATVRETDLLENEPVAPDLAAALPRGATQPARGTLIQLAPFQVATLRFHQ